MRLRALLSSAHAAWPRLRLIAPAILAVALPALWLATHHTPSVAEPTPAPAAASPPATTPTPTAPATASDVIIDLFQPSDAALDRQHSTTELSRQIENAMVVSYSLMRCDAMSQQEYSDTFNALIAYTLRARLETTPQQAEARVREIANAAAASYSMIYSATPCSDPGLPAKAAALKAWRDAMQAR